MKLCPTCKELLSFENYRKDKNRPDGLDGMCKYCRSKKEKERYSTNPTKKREYSKLRSKKGLAKYNKNSYLKYKTNGKKKVIDINRRVNKLKAIGKITKSIINELLIESDNKCFYCGIELVKYHIDHFIPLCKGGSNLKENLRISCPKCNLSKGSKIL